MDTDTPCMDTYRRRPTFTMPRPKGGTMTLYGHADGQCYLVWQSLLNFGSDSHDPRASRPVVSLLKEQHRLYVLPATTKRDDALYPIDLRRCNVKDEPNKFRYSYLSPQPELVKAWKPKEIGKLPDDLRQAIALWLRNHHAEAAR